jgi:phage terminase large subunit-like protein
VLSCTASNVAVRQDYAGNIKPNKERSSERIDGISALVNVLGRALLQTTASSFTAMDARC